MADPDTKRLNEEELEALQRATLSDLFSQLETYDARQSIIEMCEKLIDRQKQ